MKFVIILCAGLLAGIYGKPTRREYPFHLTKEANKTMSTLSLPSNATSIRADITDNFSCEGKGYGYYADVENDCQIFHVCLPVEYPDGKARNFRWSFICPDETVFSQELFTCMREEDLSVECKESERLYELNKNFGNVMEMENESSSGSVEESSAASAQAIDSNEIQQAMIASQSAPVAQMQPPAAYSYKHQNDDEQVAPVIKVAEQPIQYEQQLHQDEEEPQLNTVQQDEYNNEPSEIVNHQNEEILEIRKEMLNEFNAANRDSNEKPAEYTTAYQPEVYESTNEEPAYYPAVHIQTELPIEIIDTPAAETTDQLPEQSHAYNVEQNTAQSMAITHDLLADINSLTDQVKNIIELENNNYQNSHTSYTNSDSNNDGSQLNSNVEEAQEQQQQQQYDDSSAIEKKVARRHIRRRNKNQQKHFLFRADAN